MPAIAPKLGYETSDKARCARSDETLAVPHVRGGLHAAVQIQSSCWRHCLRSSTSLNHYFAHELEQGGYISVVKFCPTREELGAASGWKLVSSPICKDGATSMNSAARAIKFMGNRRHKMLVDYNYEQLKQGQRKNISLRLGTQKKNEIKEQKKAHINITWSSDPSTASPLWWPWLQLRQT
uniref:Predicted protein n=1 Tax=Hordeum vulgare subsp. vulgare TaxID=112509 RepID=F2EC02_HORVV|nr:predicted protein [Hordeum vulgare subsp. vulgare]